MKIGIDFDNTIVDYTGVFYQVGQQLGWLPDLTEHTKNAVKRYFIAHDKEALWTELQGVVYGRAIHQARAYHSAKQVIASWLAKGYTLYIVSHKTQYPYLGERVDLHHAALGWLLEQGIVGELPEQIPQSQVYFNETKHRKAERIAELRCDVFIDDLQEIFQLDAFPIHCSPILFSPTPELAANGSHHTAIKNAAIFRGSEASSWKVVEHIIADIVREFPNL